MLTPNVPATREAVQAINDADLDLMAIDDQGHEIYGEGEYRFS